MWRSVLITVIAIHLQNTFSSSIPDNLVSQPLPVTTVITLLESKVKSSSELPGDSNSKEKNTVTANTDEEAKFILPITLSSEQAKDINAPEPLASTPEKGSESKPAKSPEQNKRKDIQILETLVISEISKLVESSKPQSPETESPSKETEPDLAPQDSNIVFSFSNLDAETELVREISNIGANLMDKNISISTEILSPNVKVAVEKQPKTQNKNLRLKSSDATKDNGGEQQPNKISIISAIPENPLSLPSNAGSLVLPGASVGSGSLDGYTYLGASGSAELNSADKAQAQTFGWAESGSVVNPAFAGAGGHYGLGAGAEIELPLLSGSFGISSGGTAGLGYSKPGHSSSGGGLNIFSFLPASVSTVSIAGSGGYDGLPSITPAPAVTSGEQGDKEEPLKPTVAEPSGLFGLLTPLTSFPSSIFSSGESEEETPEDSDEKDEESAPIPFFGSLLPDGSGSLFGFLKPLTSLTGLTQGTITLSGGASLKPLFPHLNKPVCPEALEICINACLDVGKVGGVIGLGNRCYCSCAVPENLGGKGLCSNKYTSHCNKQCKQHLYESGHCNSISGDCECKCPLGQPCFEVVH